MLKTFVIHMTFVILKRKSAILNLTKGGLYPFLAPNDVLLR
jgi:hypothetical protein